MSLFSNYPILKPQGSSSGGTGNVSGPLSGTSTDNAIVRWDGITGTAIQDSNMIVDDNNSMVWTQTAIAGGSPTMFSLVTGAHTGLAASTEMFDIDWNLGATAQFTNGAKTLQRSVIIRPRTYSATSATTITSAATWHFAGAPVAGTNVTITNNAVVHITSTGAITPAGTGDLFITGTGGTRPFAVFRTSGSSAHSFNGFVYEMDVSSQVSLITRFIRVNSGTAGLTLGRGRNSAGTTGNDTFSPSTSINVSGTTVVSTFSPSANAPNYAGFEVNPTVNGTSTGRATGLAVAVVATALTGGTINLADFGTTSTDYHTGFTSLIRFDTSGNIISETGFVQNSVTAGITASTTQTQGQGALTREMNEVATVANANDTVTLPVAVAGRRVVVINNGANTLQIFPASGDNLGAGVNTATTLTTATNIVFQAYDATNWETI